VGGNPRWNLFQKKEMSIDYETYRRLDKNGGNIPKVKDHLSNAIDVIKELEAYGWVEKYEKKLGE